MQEPDKQKYPGKAGLFKSFNDAYDRYVVEARKVMRDTAASGKILDSNVESLYRSREAMRSLYNSFIQ